jgi:3-oxoacyl-[acyl-carrier protein] reductase
MNLALNKKRVLITGASKGVGTAIAHGFLEEGAKACMVSKGSEQLYNTKSSLVQIFGEEYLIAEECDCTDRDSLILLEERIGVTWGGVDFVVANDGNGRSVSNPLSDEEQWNETWNNNFKSSLQTALVFLPMLQKSKGCLLFVSSMAARGGKS